MDEVRRSLLITISISLLSVIAVIWFTMDGEAVAYFTNIDLRYIALAIAFHLGSWFMWSSRMKVLTGATGGFISSFTSFKILMCSLFAAGITPSEVGGEPVKIYLLTEENMSLGDATAIIFTERFLDVIFLVLISPIGIFVFRDIVLKGSLIIIPVIAVIFFFGVFSVVAMIMFRPDLVKRIANWTFEFVQKVWKSDRIKDLRRYIEEEIDTFVNSMWSMARNGYGLVAASVLTVARWGLELCIAPLILLAIGSEPYLLYSFAAQILLVVLLLAPITPGGSGIAELGSTAIFSTFIEGAMVGVFVVVFRLVAYHFNLIVGLVASIVVLKDMSIIRRFLG
ncbi:MAG: flippase-like domain-containing protein [Halobacteriota archaeon]|nr:flippase-like domain-containing protein [Halobacteriota archaeon]